MNLKSLKNTEELQTFLDRSQAIAFSVPGNKTARYGFIQSVLKQFHYRALTKRQKGIVIRFLLQVTAYSRQQLTRLIHQYLRSGIISSNVLPISQQDLNKNTQQQILLYWQKWTNGMIRQAVQ